MKSQNANIKHTDDVEVVKKWFPIRFHGNAQSKTLKNPNTWKCRTKYKKEKTNIYTPRDLWEGRQDIETLNIINNTLTEMDQGNPILTQYYHLLREWNLVWLSVLHT